MELTKILHMNGGDGERSYATNSGLQKVVISKTWAVLDESLKDMFSKVGFPKCMRIADLGCSSGPNTLFLISHIIHTIHRNLSTHETNDTKELPQFEIFLNDLPDNDFNNLFKLVSTDFIQDNENQRKSKCFIYGAPGSFYGRLFPSNSIHFVYSSCSIHWLSQVPEGLGKANKENIYVAPESPPHVFEAYAKQFRRDFSRFLSLRAQELTYGGCMVLAFIGRSVSNDFGKEGARIYTLVAESLSDMIAEGLVTKDDLHSFNMPIYHPCLQEVEDIICDEGSFNLDKMEVVTVAWDANNYDDDDDDDDDSEFDPRKSGKLVAKCVRALMEPMLVRHFGSSPNVDRLFDIFMKRATEELLKDGSFYYTPLISLIRKQVDLDDGKGC